jgi:hypothetical protein
MRAMGGGLSSLTIAGGGTGATTDVRLNGQEVPGLRELVLEISAENATVVTLVIGVDDVDVDADTIVALQAIVKKIRNKDE